MRQRPVAVASTNTNNEQYVAWLSSVRSVSPTPVESGIQSPIPDATYSRCAFGERISSHPDGSGIDCTSKYNTGLANANNTWRCALERNSSLPFCLQFAVTHTSTVVNVPTLSNADAHSRLLPYGIGDQINRLTTSQNTTVARYRSLERRNEGPINSTYYSYTRFRFLSPRKMINRSIHHQAQIPSLC